MCAVIVALLPTSPRRRRRVAWLAACTAVVAVAVVAIMLLPTPTQLPETFHGQASIAPPHVRLSKADRRRIERVVDRFVLAAVERRDPSLAFDLSGPNLRGTSTRANWVAGDIPVAAFPARGRRFHGWTHVSATPAGVVFDLLIQPRPGATVGATAFGVQAVRRGGNWVVDGWYPKATFTSVGTKHPRIVGPADRGANYNAPGKSHTSLPTGRLSRWWLAVPLAIVCFGLAAIGLIVGRNWLRYRRMRAAVRAAIEQEGR
jgi:uncharacterized RDD family membrane protein YckC